MRDTKKRQARSALSLSACHLGLPLLLSLDLGLDSLPVNLDLLVKLLKPIIRLLLVVLLKEALAVGNHRVDVGLLRDGNVECLIPLVQLDVHFNRSVEETSTKQDLLGF